MGWTQPGQRDLQEPADGSIGGKAAGYCERVEGVSGELVRRNIVPYVAGLYGLGKQISDETLEPSLRSRGVFTAVNERGDLGAVMHVRIRVGAVLVGMSLVTVVIARALAGDHGIGL